MLLLDEVVPGAERHEMSVIGRRRNRHRSSAAHVSVAQLVGETLQFIGSELIIVPEHVVVRRPRCALDAGMRAEIEVEFGRMRDADVDRCSGGNIARLAHLLLPVGAE